MKTYNVTLPIGGHAFLTVEANSEEEAIDAAMNEVTLQHLEDWEVLTQVNRGNVCYFPSPWQAEAIEE